MTFQALRGTADLFGPTLARWEVVEATCRDVAHRYGYREIRTPIMEDAGLFLRSVGETTDIVQKEMFLFKDRGDRSIVLRPEGTSAVVRAYLEHHLHKIQGQAKLFYLGPMFRAERPQAGRMRQFHQVGAEALGSYSPLIDAELIALCMDMLRANGVTGASLWLSSMGCRDDQERSAQALRDRLRPSLSQLCPECQARFEKNVFRVLDCKNPTCRELAWRGQASPFLLCADCQAHFDAVRRALTNIGVAFDDTKVFARGLDYYTRTVFEVKVSGLGAQDAVAAGGRYDRLIEELGGPPTGAIGFAAGLERMLAAIDANRPAGDGAPARAGIYIAPAQPSLSDQAFRLVDSLRRAGIETTMDHEGRSLKAQLREADKLGCRWMTVLGEREVAQGRVTVKDLTGGQEHEVSLADFVGSMRHVAKRETQGTTS